LAAIAALMTTGIYADNAGTFTVNGTVDAAAVVRIGEPVTLGLTSGEGVFEDSVVTMNEGNPLPLDATTSSKFDVYVLTNTLGAVTMSFTEVKPLVNTGENAALTTTYDFVGSQPGAIDASNIAAGDLIQVSDGGPRDNEKVGELIVGVTTLAASLAGDYQAVMNMTVTTSI